jgi:hypothetical protein
MHEKFSMVQRLIEAEWAVLLTPTDLADQDGPGDYVRGGVMMTVAGIDLAPVREVERLINELPPDLKRVVYEQLSGLRTPLRK